MRVQRTQPQPSQQCRCYIQEAKRAKLSKARYSLSLFSLCLGSMTALGYVSAHSPKHLPLLESPCRERKKVVE